MEFEYVNIISYKYGWYSQWSYIVIEGLNWCLCLLIPNVQIIVEYS